MTNNDNNNERRNEMTLEFDTEVTNEELEAIAAEEDTNDYDELDSFVDNEDFIDHNVSLDETIDSFNQFDEERDLDFYES